MNLKLQGKRALVTGSTAGIGERIAVILAREGATLIIHGRNRERAQHVAESIHSQGGSADIVLGDLGSDSGCHEIATAVGTVCSSIDVLINNAAVYVNRSWDETSPLDWLDIYNSNVCSAVRITRQLLPGMRAKAWGRIIQISTGEAMAPMPHMPEYAASKAGLANLTVSFAQQVAGTGITVNTVSPASSSPPSCKDSLPERRPSRDGAPSGRTSKPMF